MIVCETERLILRHFELSDAEYIVKQLNDSFFIQFIGDKHVRILVDAEKYLKEGPIESYRKFGYGLNVICLKLDDSPIGMCGLVKRDELEYPDLGFAFLPEFFSKGYATEASKAIIEDAFQVHKLNILLGITLPNNQASNRLLTRLGFIQKGSIEINGFENNLYEFFLRRSRNC